jgi:hypothetical protein
VQFILHDCLKQPEQLSYEERLELIQKVAEQMKQRPPQPKPKHKISEFREMVKYPFFGEDAQDWVPRTRREGDEHRERVFRGEE